MKNITRHTGILHVMERLDNSYYGNPRYLISIDGWQCKTGVDSSHAYGITNYEGKKVTATIGTHYNAATLNTIEGE